MKQPLLSVVIPVYNAQRYVGAMIDSVLTQTFKEFELIVVNDGSKDDSLDVLNSYAEKDGRIVVINQRNQGPSAARNAGIEKARGDYIMFLDADDDIEEDYFQSMLSNIGGVDLVIAGLRMVYINNERERLFLPKEDRQYESVDMHRYIISSAGEDGIVYSPWNKLYRRSIIATNKVRFDISLKNGEDLVFNIIYLSHCRAIKACRIAKYLYIQRGTGENLFANTARTTFADRQKMYDTILKYFGSSSDPVIQNGVKWLYYKWLLSNIFAVSAYRGTIGDKKRILRNNLKGARLLRPKLTRSYIGGAGPKKFFATLTAIVATRSVYLALVVGAMGNYLKGVR